MIAQICPEASYDASLGTCSDPQWAYVSDGLLPPLSVSDALTLGSAVVLCWSIGFGFRIIRRFLFK